MMQIYKVFSDFFNVPGACDAASEYCSSLSAHHASDTVTFYDSNGKLEVERTMSYVPDVKTTMDTISSIRHLHKYRNLTKMVMLSLVMESMGLLKMSFC